jgi:hypothetical protein
MLAICQGIGRFIRLMMGEYFGLARTTFYQLVINQSYCDSTLHCLNFEDSFVNVSQTQD